MTQFTTATLSRDEFLDWLGGGGGRQVDKSSGEPSEGAEQVVTLVWDGPRDETRKQPLIAMPVQGMNDFFAFTSTYVATYRPYSAFYHVIPLELVEQIEQRRELDNSMLPRFAKLVAGGALAEQYLRSRSRSASFGASLTAANATLCASLGAAIVAGYPPAVLAWITDQWSSAHLRGENYSVDQAATIEIAPIWRLMFSTVHGEVDGANYHGNMSAMAVSGFILAALGGGVTAELLGSLGPDLPTNEDPVKVLLAPREERIRSFNRFVASMGETASDGLEQPFMAGLLLAIAGNGSFDMLRSAKELAERSPAAIVWFGICAALFEDSNVLTVGNCRGRRIVRDLRAPGDMFDAPNSDLGAFEYRVLSRDPAALDQANSTSADAFCLELLPGVVTYVPRQVRDHEVQERDDYQVLAEGLAEMRYVLDRTQRRLSRSPEPKQREMYRSDTKPRGRTRS